jgi:hypothetical protein
MTECDRIRGDAPGLAALDPRDPDRLGAMAHASGCAGCARAMEEAERLQLLLSAWEPAALPAGALERGSREIRAQLRREARRRLFGSVSGVCGSVLVFVVFGRSRSRSASDWALAAGLWALAVVLASTASRKPLLTTALAVAGGVAAALISGTPGGPLAGSLGIECLATEAASAAIVVGAVWLAYRGGTTSPPSTAIAVAAAVGALAGDAALQVTCAAHTALPHVLAFHVGGIALAAAAATVVSRTTQRVPA